MVRDATRLVGIVSALPEEIRPLKKRLQNPSRTGLPGAQAVVGDLGSHRVALATTGDGAALAKTGCEGLLAAFDLEALLAIGIAGGLSDDLEVGSVVTAERVVNGAGEVPVPDARLLARSAALQKDHQGTVYSHSEIAIDPIAKERLWRQLGGVPASVVDLESASYARTAADHGVPYLVLRAVSDSYDEALPLDFNRFRQADGSSDRGRILRYTLRHPSIIPELLQLRERLRHCAEKLAVLVEEILSR
jgi:adenosylhomocysteine nucleosidase